MSIDYNIPEKTYEKLMFEICKEYDEKFSRLSYIVNHIPENRYELPQAVGDKVTLRMGSLIAYIKKPTGDLFDIEYAVEFKMNAKMFIDFINTYLRKHYYHKFNFDNYTYKDEFLNELAKYISDKYNIKYIKIYQNGGYIEFDITVWMCPDTRIIYI